MSDQIKSPETSEKAKAKKTRGPRSPSFPSLDLEAAIEKVRDLYRHDQDASIPLEVAVKRWGNTIKSSTAKQTLAALKAYGLLEKKGQKVQLTELALDIVMEGSPGRAEAISKAARNPIAFLRLLEDTEAPRSEDALRFDLIRHKGFNKNSVDDFIRNFKNTMAFAKANGADSVISEEEVGEAAAAPSGGLMHQPVQQAPTRAAPSTQAIPSGWLPPMSFPLPGGNLFEVRLKSEVTEEEFKVMETMFGLLKSSFVKATPESEE